jgi:hypothetical protein
MVLKIDSVELFCAYQRSFTVYTFVSVLEYYKLAGCPELQFGQDGLPRLESKSQSRHRHHIVYLTLFG